MQKKQRFRLGRMACALAAGGLAALFLSAAGAEPASPAGAKLQGKKVAILVAEGFEQVEMTEPPKTLEEAGAKTVLISPEDGNVKAWDKKD